MYVTQAQILFSTFNKTQHFKNKKKKVVKIMQQTKIEKKMEQTKLFFSRFVFVRSVTIFTCQFQNTFHNLSSKTVYNFLVRSTLSHSGKFSQCATHTDITLFLMCTVLFKYMYTDDFFPSLLTNNPTAPGKKCKEQHAQLKVFIGVTPDIFCQYHKWKLLLPKLCRPDKILEQGLLFVTLIAHLISTT